jgi:hypothetical protein
MSVETILVKISSETGTEDMYFKEKDQEKIRKFREKINSEKNQQYSEAHRYHCFRCGTPSLAEIERGDVKIDICVNEDCGAVHLDPGELDNILKDRGIIKNVRTAIFSVFK